METNPSATGPKQLVTKLAKIMGEIGKVPKNGENSFHHYKFVRESDLVEAIRDKLAAEHVFMTSSVKGTEVVELSKVVPKTGEVIITKIGILRVEYTFHDGDSGEKLTIEGVGEIDQDGGKGVYKALTGSLKYALLKNFLIASGDDPEDDGRKPVGKPRFETATSPAPSAPAPRPRAKDPDAKATPAQLKLIDKLAKEKGIDLQTKVYGPLGTDAPTKTQASAIIDRLVSPSHIA